MSHLSVEPSKFFNHSDAIVVGSDCRGWYFQDPRSPLEINKQGELLLKISRVSEEAVDRGKVSSEYYTQRHGARHFSDKEVTFDFEELLNQQETSNGQAVMQCAQPEPIEEAFSVEAKKQVNGVFSEVVKSFNEVVKEIKEDCSFKVTPGIPDYKSNNERNAFRARYFEEDKPFPRELKLCAAGGKEFRVHGRLLCTDVPDTISPGKDRENFQHWLDAQRKDEQGAIFTDLSPQALDLWIRYNYGVPLDGLDQENVLELLKLAKDNDIQELRLRCLYAIEVKDENADMLFEEGKAIKEENIMKRALNVIMIRYSDPSHPEFKDFHEQLNMGAITEAVGECEDSEALSDELEKRVELMSRYLDGVNRLYKLRKTITHRLPDYGRQPARKKASENLASNQVRIVIERASSAAQTVAERRLKDAIALMEYSSRIANYFRALNSSEEVKPHAHSCESDRYFPFDLHLKGTDYHDKTQVMPVHRGIVENIALLDTMLNCPMPITQPKSKGAEHEGASTSDVVERSVPADPSPCAEAEPTGVKELEIPVDMARFEVVRAMAQHAYTNKVDEQWTEQTAYDLFLKANEFLIPGLREKVEPKAMSYAVSLAKDTLYKVSVPCHEREAAKVREVFTSRIEEICSHYQRFAVFIHEEQGGVRAPDISARKEVEAAREESDKGSSVGAGDKSSVAALEED